MAWNLGTTCKALRRTTMSMGAALFLLFVFCHIRAVSVRTGKWGWGIGSQMIGMYIDNDGPAAYSAWRINLVNRDDPGGKHMFQQSYFRPPFIQFADPSRDFLLDRPFAIGIPWWLVFAANGVIVILIIVTERKMSSYKPAFPVERKM